MRAGYDCQYLGEKALDPNSSEDLAKGQDERGKKTQAWAIDFVVAIG